MIESTLLEIETVTNRLDILSRAHPELAKACAYYRSLLPLLIQAETEVIPSQIGRTRAQQKLDDGQPILLGEDLPFSSQQIRSLFPQISEVTTASPAPQPSFQAICQAVGTGRLDLVPVLSALLAGNLDLADELAREFELEKSQFASILQNCMRPSLHAWAAALAPQVDLSAWLHGSCPFCGSLPALAVLRGPQRVRSLHCAMCGAEWPFNRMQCAGCENTDARSLGLIWVEGEAESQSVQACDSCKFYLKLLTILEPFPAWLLPVLDLETIHLDLLASQRGYHRTA